MDRNLFNRGRVSAKKRQKVEAEIWKQCGTLCSKLDKTTNPVEEQMLVAELEEVRAYLDRLDEADSPSNYKYDRDYFDG